MPGKRIEDLGNVEVEHLLGLVSKLPLVKLRAESDGTVLVGQIDPAAAREIAVNLHAAAARAEYEYDLFLAAQRHGYEDHIIGGLLMLVREGEVMRETGDTDD